MPSTTRFPVQSASYWKQPQSRYGKCWVAGKTMQTQRMRARERERKRERECGGEVCLEQVRLDEVACQAASNCSPAHQNVFSGNFHERVNKFISEEFRLRQGFTLLNVLSPSKQTAWAPSREYDFNALLVSACMLMKKKILFCCPRKST